MDAPEGITVTPVHFEIPPIFWDFPFLDTDTIWDAWKGVFYFNITADPTIERGKVYQINFTLQGDNIPEYFRIAPGILGIKDLDGKVYMPYGRASNITLWDKVPFYVQVQDVRIANESEKESFESVLVADNETAINETFNQLRQITFSTYQEGNGSNPIEVIFNLPDYASTMPWNDNSTESYRLYLIVRAETLKI